MNKRIRKKKSAMRGIEHKGYRLIQSSNNHYMIFDDTGYLKMHAQCSKKLTKKEMHEAVENYLYFANMTSEEKEERHRRSEEIKAEIRAKHGVKL